LIQRRVMQRRVLGHLMGEPRCGKALDLEGVAADQMPFGNIADCQQRMSRVPQCASAGSCRVRLVEQDHIANGLAALDRVVGLIDFVDGVRAGDEFVEQ